MYQSPVFLQRSNVEHIALPANLRPEDYEYDEENPVEDVSNHDPRDELYVEDENLDDGEDCFPNFRIDQH